MVEIPISGVRRTMLGPVAGVKPSETMRAAGFSVIHVGQMSVLVVNNEANRRTAVHARVVLTTLPDLPVIDALPRLMQALDCGNAVLVAPPGAGKTTVVPLALLDAPWRGDGRIIVLEPRRLAARAAATRMAGWLGEPVGQTVGYRTRLDSAVSSQTRVEVITEGLLVRRLIADATLDGVAAVLLDEIHERSLDADLALALCLDLQRLLRPELRLLAMSATLDGARLSSLLNGPVIESQSRMFPVMVEHASRDIMDPRDLPEAVARAVRAALSAHQGDILAFLPGMGEIRRAQSLIDGCGATVLPLHGELPVAEQDLALTPAAGRRVVLSTSIAETSLTVPGVRVIVDCGWRRIPRLDAGSGLTRLTTVRISRAAADQRAGRAGREAAGVAVRLWTLAMQRGLAQHDRPEILEAELAGLVLDCAAWGTAPESLPFPDPPIAGTLAVARALLHKLGALQDGTITPLGRRMASLGAHPRLAAMMLAATSPGEGARAADLAALLEERDPLRGRDLAAGIDIRLDALDGRADADRGAVARIRRQAARYRRQLGGSEATAEGDPGPLLAAAFPDRIAQRREPGSFRFSGGGGGKLPRGDSLANEPFLVVAALDPKSTTLIRLAAPLDLLTLPRSVAAQITETAENGFDAVQGAVLCRRRRRLGALILDDRMIEAEPGDTASILAAAALRAPETLPWSPAARQLQARAGFLRTLDPDTPDLGDSALAADAQLWLAPALLGMRRLVDLAGLDLVTLLRNRLGWAVASRLDVLLPTHVTLPGGRAGIDYEQSVPIVSARAQHFYGLDRTPQIAEGRILLRLALLSPAGRPIAVTSDLAGFWRGAWSEVRREMRGRYPRHDWPETPHQIEQ